MYIGNMGTPSYRQGSSYHVHVPFYLHHARRTDSPPLCPQSPGHGMATEARATETHRDAGEHHFMLLQGSESNYRGSDVGYKRT